MKGELTLKILEFLAEAAQGTGDLIACFLTDYATSYRRLKGLSQKTTSHDRATAARAERQRFYNLLAKLKREGLVRRAENGIWHLTMNGIRQKQKLLTRKQLLLPPALYVSTKTDGYKLIAFDIPERERRKRAWLRTVLRRLEFRPLQKSLWIGKAELPEAFLEDIRSLHLLPHVEILAITRTGSVRHLV